MSNKIQLIIWSRDRACQCETLLNSIQQFAPDLFNIDLIYSYSDEKYLDGYRKLFTEYNEKVKFHKKEVNCGKNLLLSLTNANKLDTVCFTTDDTILYQSIPATPSLMMSDCDIFSLRLGRNTIIQNHVTKELQPILNANEGFYDKCNISVLDWNFQNYPPLCNYGYPFGLDMVCYSKSMIVPLIEKCSFDKPPELESQLIRFRGAINPKIKCFEQSCAINIPISNMTGITQHAGVSLEELNSKFLEGKKLRYKLDEVKIVGCHQLLEYELV